MNTKHDELRSIISAEYKHFGLDAEVVLRYDLDQAFQIYIAKEIEILPLDDTAAIMAKSVSILQDIHNSPYMRSLRKRHQDKVEKLQEEIERLKEFETYFNMEKKMRGFSPLTVTKEELEGLEDK